MSKIKSFLLQITTPKYQLLTQAFAIIIILISLYPRIYQFRPVDPIPPIIPITPIDIKKWGTEPTPIQTGFHIVSFKNFDINLNIFSYEGIVWFLFDPTLISLNTISKFSIMQGEITYKSNPETKLIEEKLFVRYHIRINFTCNINHRHFPLDSHQIPIVFVNESISPHEAIFIAYETDFSISPKLAITNWSILDSHTQTGYLKSDLDPLDSKKDIYSPQVIYTLDIIRNSTRGVLIIFLPLLFLFFTTFFSLSLDPKSLSASVERYSITSITALIAYRFVIDQMSPKVGYFMLSDYLFLLFLGCMFPIALVGFLLINRGALTHSLSILRGVIFLSSYITFLILWYYFLYFWY